MSYSTPPLDFFLQVRKGRIMGHKAFTLSGANNSVGTIWETLWPEGGLISYPIVATALTISSSNASDTSAGEGLLTVEIKGLDANFKDLTETIPLNGQTGVITSNSYYRVTSLVGQTAGPSGSNQGTIYAGTGVVTGGKPAIVYEVISQNKNKSHSGRFTTRARETCHNVFTLLSSDAPILVEQYARPPGGLFYASGSAVVNGSVAIAPRAAPQLVAGMDYELRVKSVVGTAQAHSYTEFLEVDTRAG